MKPPNVNEVTKEQGQNNGDDPNKTDMKKPEVSMPISPESPSKDQKSLPPVMAPPKIYAPAPPKVPEPETAPSRKDIQQPIAPKLPESIKPIANKPAAPKIDVTKPTTITKKPQPQQDIKAKAEPKFKCSAETFKASLFFNKATFRNENPAFLRQSGKSRIFISLQ